MKSTSRGFFIGLLLLIIGLVFLIVKPFLTTIISSIVLAYFFYPVYNKIHKKVKHKNAASLITTLLVVLIITLPLIFMINTIGREARMNYILIKQRIMSANILTSECDAALPSCQFLNRVKETLSAPAVKYYLEQAVKKVTERIIEGVSGFLLSIPAIFINLFIMVFIMFYLFRDGADILRKIKELSPLHKLHNKRILTKFDNVIYSVIFGYLFIAVVQGFLGTLGLFFAGISSPILWGLVMAFFAILPLVGPSMVWGPFAAFLIFDGYSTANNSLIIKGILLILYGVFIIAPIDILLRPKIIGDRAKIHPVLVLLGVLGGLRMFGFIGIIIGPVVLALFMTFLSIYEQQKGALFR